MMRSWGRWSVGLGLCAVLLVFGAISGDSAQEPDGRLLDKVFADWQHRRTRVKTVKYVARGEGLMPKHSTRLPPPLAKKYGDVPPKDIVYPIQYCLLIDFTKKRHRFEIDSRAYDVGSGELRPVLRTQIFDGKELKGYDGRKTGEQPTDTAPAKGEVGISTGDLRNAAFDPAVYPMFAGHGIFAVHGARIIPGQLGEDLDRSLFYVHGTGVYAGRTCLVLRTRALQGESPVFDELWVDLERESAVLRLVLYQGKNITNDTAIEYQQTPGGWLPSRWVFSHMSKGSSISLQKRMKVTDLQVNLVIPEELFQIEIKPGMLVGKSFHSPDEKNPYETIDQQRQYRVANDGSWEEVVTEGGVERKKWRYIRLLWAIPVFVGAGAIFWLVRRRRRTKEV